MRFWDSSALVPVFVEEPRSAEVRDLLFSDREVFVSILTRLEIASALWRRTRAGQLAPGERELADRSFAAIQTAWTEVGNVLEIRESAIELLAKYPLRAADAFQLASAIKATNSDLGKIPFVTLDHDLAVAAMSEGFTVLP